MPKQKPKKRKVLKMVVSVSPAPSTEQQLLEAMKANRRLIAQTFDDWFAVSLRTGSALDAAAEAERAATFLRQRQAGVIPEYGVEQADQLFNHLTARISRNSA